MVWADTTDIGCGVASCRMYGLSIVCRYGSSINWNNKQPYEVKSRELCPKEQNIPKDGFQSMHDDAPLSIVNINNKLSTTGSSRSRVLHNRLNSRCISLKDLQFIRLYAPNIWKDLHYFSKGNRGGTRHVYTQRQQIGSKILF
ncbi:unnamed protein product [Schistosoma mattheei]|uniref:Uncharacterized protein n=1 Tax=Schistosoma mattheei TaxID=31246 RepID=A0A183Q564_9TREM|nr:unnamed protein product [Schistosoma mattheei]